MNVFSYNKYDTAARIQNLARALSVVSIVVIGLFVFGEPWGPSSLTLGEGLLMVFFPFSVIAGLIIAWWRESIGSLIAIAGLGAFYVIHVAISGRAPTGLAFLVFTSPAFLFLAHWVITRHETRT